MRTQEQIAEDYSTFRGKCYEMSKALADADPSLRLVRGHYFCLHWAREEEHWWCEKQDGTIIDPTARQFPCNGAGVYTEFNGVCECAECGKEVPEAEVYGYGNYAFCRAECAMRFVGL